jgi:hypothetical protein
MFGGVTPKQGLPHGLTSASGRPGSYLIIPHGTQGVASEMRACRVAPLARTFGTVLRGAPCDVQEGTCVAGGSSRERRGAQFGLQRGSRGIMR